MRNYHLDFEIPPDLYVRAVTVPIDGMPSRGRVMAQNIAALILAPLSLYCFNVALFGGHALVPMAAGFCLGAVLVLAVWWRRHRMLVARHSAYNDAAGRQVMDLSAGGITVSREHIQSRIDWPLVRALRGIDGASLIELPTARLIVPDAALPDGVAQAAFLAQLTDWREASA